MNAGSKDPAYEDPAYEDPAYEDPACEDPTCEDPTCEDPARGDARVEAGVRMVIQEVSRRDISAIGRDDDLVEALGVDSLEGLQILAKVEKRFDVRLPDDELIHLRTIGRIADSVERQQRGGV
jgi:acyl carrier protein